jgi:hypothetical protein
MCVDCFSEFSAIRVGIREENVCGVTQLGAAYVTLWLRTYFLMRGNVTLIFHSSFSMLKG